MLRLVPLIVLIACLGWGCSKDDGQDRPVSGLKLVTPRLPYAIVDSRFLADSVFLFEGAALAQAGLARGLVGIKYAGFAYEQYEGPEVVAQDSLFEFALGGTLVRSVQRPIHAVESPLQGRYKLYSQVSDVNGKRSDTNVVYRYVVNPRFVQMQLAQPVLSNGFTRSGAGAVVQVRGSVLPGYPRPDSIRLALCPFAADGRLDCPDAGIAQLTLRVDSVNAFSGQFELPFNATTGQRFRIRVQAADTGGSYFTRLLPGVEIFNQ